MAVPGRSIQRPPSPSFSAEASSTSGPSQSGTWAMPPGPTRRTSASGGTIPCQGRTMASGTWAATSARTSGSGRTVTRPAPTRRAPRADSTAAPLMPRLPARMATCPKLPLCASQARGGSTGRSSSCSAALGVRSRGMGTTVISPQVRRAGIRPWQTLRCPKQAVRVARMASPGISAELGSRPEGRSRASTGRPEAFRARAQARATPSRGRVVPSPKSPSTTQPRQSCMASAGAVEVRMSPPSPFQRRA